MKLAGSLLAALGAAALTAACNTGRQLPQFQCPAVTAVQYRLIYPAPGSTAIPDALNLIVVEPNAAGARLFPPSGGFVPAIMPTAVPNPLPSPNAAPADPAMVAFSVAPLAAATTYTVLVGSFGVDCDAGGQTVGSFTTQ